MEKAERFNAGKPRWSLVDFDSLTPLVRVLEYGEKKYSRDNWKKGFDKNELCESMMRHLIAYMNGEDVDQESGELHVGHMLANAHFMAYCIKNKRYTQDDSEVLRWREEAKRGFGTVSASTGPQKAISY